MSEKRVIDWESVERDYRAGVLSLREIGAERLVSAPMILKRAKAEGWDRDLSARIQAKAEAAVNRAIVNAPVNGEQSVNLTEKDTIEANAAAIVSVRLRHRVGVKRGIDQCDRLMTYLESAKIEEDVKEFSTTLKQWAETHKSLVAMEREAWGIAPVAPEAPPAELPELTPERIAEGARRMALVLHRAALPRVEHG
jgi:hypothetical protein